MAEVALLSWRIGKLLPRYALTKQLMILANHFYDIFFSKADTTPVPSGMKRMDFA